MLDKAFEAIVGLYGKPVVLDHPPENLNQIEFGTIGGQKVQEEPLLFPDRNSGFELLACVNWRVVDDNGGGASERIGEIVKTANDRLTVDCAFHRVRGQLIVIAEESQSIELLALL